MGRRRQERWGIRVAGCYRSPMGADVYVSVSDVSAQGCCLLNPSRNLFVGDVVTVFVDGLDPIEADVRWHDRSVRAGFRFRTPVDEEQLALLVTHCSGRVKPVPARWRDTGDAIQARSESGSRAR